MYSNLLQRGHLLQRCFLSGLIVTSAVCITLWAQPASAQTPNPFCTCESVNPFGSCATQIIDPTDVTSGPYPDQFPGSVTIVLPGENNPRKPAAYIADLFSSRTYRYDVLAGVFRLVFKDSIPNPGSGGATTGITHKAGPDSSTLYYAVNGRIFRTTEDGEVLDSSGPVPMEELAVALREDFGDDSLPTGSLGDIAYHPTRDTLWGVDITNDVYFEFNEDGSLVIENGRPNYFAHPLRDELNGGAYGNTITYASVGDGEFFDIPAGALTDGRPTRVLRVLATNTEEGSIGDDTGVFYRVDGLLSVSGFMTGVGYWPGFCAEDQPVEMILEVNALGTDQPRIVLVSADPPTAATVADFECAVSGPDEVTCNWRNTLPYTTLQLVRKNAAVAGDEGVVIAEMASFDTDETSFVDPGVPPGSYDYVVRVTTDSIVLPEVSQSLSIGVGEVSATTLLNGTGSEDPVLGPIAVTETGVVLAVDAGTGSAQSFNADLAPIGIVAGPFMEGTVIGIAHREADQTLFWLRVLAGEYNLQATEMNGAPIGEPVVVDIPTNVNSVVMGGIDYVAEDDALWTVDLLTNTVYAFSPTGEILPAFRESQLPAPENTAELTGGISVIGRQEDIAVVDLPLRSEGSAIPDFIVRVAYDLTTLTIVGEIGRLPVKNSVRAGDIGGLDSATIGEDSFQYVVGKDTRVLYKVTTSPSSGANLKVFIRGDANNDGDVNISDPSFLLTFLFQQGATPACADSADANDSESLDITDAIFLFNYLFRNGGALPPPFPDCGLDGQSDLDCESSAGCDAAEMPEPPMEGEPPTEGEPPVDGEAPAAG